MAQRNEGNPLLNPVLSFLKQPSPTTVQGGGKNEKGIVTLRLGKQRKVLSDALFSLAKQSKSIKSHNGKVHLIARMFADSHASSWTPKDIFRKEYGCRIVSPAFDGYLLEANVDNFSEIAERIATSNSIVDKVDISRVESLAIFDAKETLRSREISDIWPDSREGVEYNFWLLPFSDVSARASVKNEIFELFRDGCITFGDDDFPDPFRPHRNGTGGGKQRLLRVLEEYVNTGTASFSAKISSADSLARIAASSTTYRIEPVAAIRTNSTPPGDGREPAIPTNNIDQLPIVVIVDGGRSAKSYQPLEAMPVPPLVDNFIANQIHGNQITSLVCHGHAWNNNLKLPELACRFVSAQAITKDGVAKQPTQDQFVAYLRGLAEETKDISKVWNLSFNEVLPSANSNEISALGHKINQLAREYGILPVISIGNRDRSGNKTLCPPADCEAALTVSGRKASPTGLPATACSVSLNGPAPAGMKKPDLSWFSHLRMIGGVTNTGTSYSTALISSLAAHTFKNLKNPTPDLVRALLINGSDQQSHCDELGWGTPWEPDQLPWICKEGTVTLAWTAKLRPGFAYYWHDVPVPDEMIRNGKLYGKASLTAILKPIVSELGGTNYFATRLQVALQAESKSGKIINLLGSMKESKAKEETARSELAKWSPIRRHAAPFSGKSINFNSVRLHARVFARDLYQFAVESHHELDEQEVSFVLTFEGSEEGSDIYNSMAKRLGTQVESAVIEQNIEVTTESGS